MIINNHVESDAIATSETVVFRLSRECVFGGPHLPRGLSQGCQLLVSCICKAGCPSIQRCLPSIGQEPLQRLYNAAGG